MRFAHDHGVDAMRICIWTAEEGDLFRQARGQRRTDKIPPTLGDGASRAPQCHSRLNESSTVELIERRLVQAIHEFTHARRPIEFAPLEVFPDVGAGRRERLASPISQTCRQIVSPFLVRVRVTFMPKPRASRGKERTARDKPRSPPPGRERS